MTDSPMRYVIASGTERYDKLGEEWSLASVPTDVETIAEIFEGPSCGYRAALRGLRLNPHHDALLRDLQRWLTDSQRTAEDVAVIYYSGHGLVLDEDFYLVTSDTEDGNYALTAVNSRTIVQLLREGSKLRRLLIVLDACYSGQGAHEIMAAVVRSADRLDFSRRGEGVWVVAASRPRQEASEGIFAEAFRDAVGYWQQNTAPVQQYIGLDAIMDTVAQRMASRQEPYYTFVGVGGFPPFFPNPRYQPGLPLGVDLDTRSHLLRFQRELAAHWARKARGIDQVSPGAWYFTGRRRALLDITSFVNRPGGPALLVVTGDPGSGKSAVLGRLVVHADPAISASLGLDAEIGLPPVRLDAALLARGKTPGDLRAELADMLGLESPSDPIASLAARPKAWIVVIDALDEASDPNAVITEFLVPLEQAARSSAGSRLLVGTRKNQLARLPVGYEPIDLDADRYLREDDLNAYIAKILVGAHAVESTSPYRHDPSLARAVAAELAGIAGHSFLIGQLAARTLASRTTALTPDEVRASRHRWHNVSSAFDRDLEGFGDDIVRVRDLLSALAWAQGTGLPRILWPSVANAVARSAVEYTDSDIAWLLDHAGAYIVEAVEDEYAVYRLYHQEFARHLSEEASVEPAQAAITRALLAHVQVAPDGRRDWRNSPPYLRAHLAAHAAAGAMLDEFLVDPGYLYSAQPDRLLNVLSAAQSADARHSATAYRLAARRLDAQPGSLGLAAVQVGAATLMANLQTLEHGARTSWIALWAWWRRPTPTQFITALGTGQRVRLTLCATARGPAAVIAYGTTIEVWDLDTGTLLDRVIQYDVVSCLTTVASLRSDVLLVGGESGALQLRTLPDLALIADRRGAHVTQVNVACVLDSQGIVATGDTHGHIALWSATDLEQRAVRENAHTLVQSLAFIRVDGDDVLLSAGDNFPVHDGAPGGMPSLRAWSLPQLGLLAEADRDGKFASWMGVLPDRESTLIFVRTASDAEVWQIHASGGPLRLIDQFQGSPIALLMTAPGQALLPSWYELAPIRVRADRVEVGELVDCEPAEWAGPIEVNRSRVVVSAGASLRTWRTDDVIDNGRTAANASLVKYRNPFIVGKVRMLDDVVLVGTEDGSVHGFEIGTGRRVLGPFGTGDPVSDIAAVEINGTSHILRSTIHGDLGLFDGNGVAVWSVHAALSIRALATAVICNRPVVVTAGEVENRLYACRIWDAASGTELGSRDEERPGMSKWRSAGLWRLAVAGYRRDKAIRSICSSASLGTWIVAAASNGAGVLPVWALERQELIRELRVDDEGTLAVAFGYGRLFAVSRHGKLYGWQLLDWRNVFEAVLPSGVTCMAVATYCGEPCILTGGADGCVQVWSLDGGHVTNINVDEQVGSIDARDDVWAIGTIRGVAVIRVPS